MPIRLRLIMIVAVWITLVLVDIATAQYDYLWHTETTHPSGLIGGANMDSDPVTELVFAGLYYGSQRVTIVDGATGAIEWDSGDWVQIQYTQLVDANGDGMMDILFYGYQVTTPHEFFVVSFAGAGVAVDEPSFGVAQLPKLDRNYPNPFNPTTTIAYEITSPGLVQVDIYNVRGQCIRHLEDTEHVAGEYTVVWNGRDDSNRELPSGTYFYQLKVNDYTSSKKALLVK